MDKNNIKTLVCIVAIISLAYILYSYCHCNGKNALIESSENYQNSDQYEDVGQYQKLPKYVLNYDKTDNHLGIKINKQDYSKNYFMIIGDWGGNNVGHGANQKAVADMMLKYYNDNSDKTLLFIVTCGDNFYYHGQSGKTWDKTWASVYDKKLLSVPWFPVMGNHDWGNDDQYCLCPEKNKKAKSINGQKYHCNQLNSDKGIKRPPNTTNYYFPDFCYHYSINELGFELIAVSADYIDAPKGIGGNGVAKGKGAYETNLRCKEAGIDLKSKLKTIYEAGVDLVTERGKVSQNKSILITNHYPARSFGSHSPAHTDLKDFFVKASKNKNQKVISAGGHIHSIGCKTMQGGACVEMLSGGGGGCCDKKPVKNASGFFAVHFDKNKDMYTKQVSYPYHISAQTGFPHTEPLDVPHPPDEDESIRHEHERRHPHDHRGIHRHDYEDDYEGSYENGYEDDHSERHHHHREGYRYNGGNYHRNEGYHYDDETAHLYQPMRRMTEYYRGPLDQLY